MIPQNFQLPVNAPGIALGVSGSPAHQAGKGVQLLLKNLQGVLHINYGGGRLHLSHDAAHLFAAEYIRRICTVRKVAGLGSRDAADVVAHLPVAHGFLIAAGADDSGADSGDTADIRHSVGGLRIADGVQGDVGQLHGVLLGGSIDARPVLALANDAHIFTGNAAHKMLALDCPFRQTVLNGAGNRVSSRDAAHIAASGKASPKSTPGNGSTVVSRNAAHFRPAAAGMNLGLHSQVLHLG